MVVLKHVNQFVESILPDGERIMKGEIISCDLHTTAITKGDIICNSLKLLFLTFLNLCKAVEDRPTCCVLNALTREGATAAITNGDIIFQY